MRMHKGIAAQVAGLMSSIRIAALPGELWLERFSDPRFEWRVLFWNL
jgi:hypothetical protein